jgi:hypothetical protein
MAASDSDLVEMHLRNSAEDSDHDMEISEPPPLPSIQKPKVARVLSSKSRQTNPEPPRDQSNSSPEDPKRTVENHSMLSNLFAKRSNNRSQSERERCVVLPRTNHSGAHEISSFQEQKHWISSVLTAASAAGEETVRFEFSEDKHLSEGCGACGPDFSDRDFAVDPHGNKSPLSTQIWSSKRSCLWLQSCCWKFYNSACFRWLFRGNDGQYPKLEPAQKFRCGWKMLQERGCVLFFLFLIMVIVALAAFPTFLRFAYYIQIACVDYSKIQKFSISCNGCKIQITNHIIWAGWFAPCNVNLFFPTDGSFDSRHILNNDRIDMCISGQTPSFCDYTKGVCNLEIQHRSETVSFSSIENLLSMETQDYLVRRSHSTHSCGL